MMELSDNNSFTLRGSSEVVTEFFEYCVNNILYQRGIYPPESFKRVPKYGLSMVITTDESVSAYITNIINQLNAWLLNKNVQKLILVVKGLETNSILERWSFNCEVEKNSENFNSNQPSKSIKEITQEIQAIMRQITASVTFLPLLAETCSFDLLVYTDKDAEVPMTWEDSDPFIIKKGDEVALRSFSTKVHKIDVKVRYKVEDNAI